MLGLQLVTIRIENERGIVGLTVVRPEPRAAVIASTVGKGRSVKGAHRLCARCNQREMEPWPCGERTPASAFKNSTNFSSPVGLGGPYPMPSAVRHSRINPSGFNAAS